MISGSLVKMSAVLPLEGERREPGGAGDPNHRDVVFFEEVLMTWSVLLHSKTNTICKKCAQNVKLYGTVSERGLFSPASSPFIFLVFMLLSPKAVYGLALL